MLADSDFFTSAELGLTDLNPFITCNISEQVDDDGNATGMVFAILTVQEDFAFHRDLDNKYPDDYAGKYFQEEDADFAPTADVEAALHKLIEERYDGENFRLDDTGGEYFEFDIVLTVPADTTPEDLGTKFWEDTALVQFHNESDPGTFGSPYLFGSLMSEALGNR